MLISYFIPLQVKVALPANENITYGSKLDEADDGETDPTGSTGVSCLSYS